MAYRVHGVFNEQVSHRDENPAQHGDQGAHHGPYGEPAFQITAGHDGEQQPGPTLTGGASGASMRSSWQLLCKFQGSKVAEEEI